MEGTWRVIAGERNVGMSKLCGVQANGMNAENPGHFLTATLDDAERWQFRNLRNSGYWSPVGLRSHTETTRFEPDNRAVRMTYMFASPFQFRLWHFFAASTVSSLACWFVISVILPSAAIGSCRDLPRFEQMIVAAMHQAGVSVCDRFT